MSDNPWTRALLYIATGRDPHEGADMTDTPVAGYANMTSSELDVELSFAAIEATKHRRCGDSRCRRNALAEVDKILDEQATRTAKVDA
jgi:hypothetical protein